VQAVGWQARRAARLAELGFADLAAYLRARHVAQGWSIKRMRAELRVGRRWLVGELARLGRDPDLGPIQRCCGVSGRDGAAARSGAGWFSPGSQVLEAVALHVQRHVAVQPWHWIVVGTGCARRRGRRRMRERPG
jgi:hypothetical protein